MTLVRAKGTRKAQVRDEAGRDRLIDLFAPVRRLAPRRLPGRNNFKHRASMPLTPIQQAVYDVLCDEPLTPTQIAERCGLTRNQVSSAVLYVSAKDKAMRKGGGWVRA